MRPQLEKIQHGQQASFTWRSSVDDGFDFLWHHHPEVELTLITRGAGRRFVGDSIETFGPGDLVLLGANLPHTWHATDPLPAATASIVIQFNEDFAGKDIWHQPEAIGVRRLLEHAKRGLHFPPNHRGVADLMHSMREQSRWDRLLTLLKALGELAAGPEAGRTLSGLTHTLPPRRDDQKRIDVVCRLIAERYAEPLDQSAVADTIHLSPSSFSRFFKRMTGRTFVAYIHELRIADACRRLVETEHSITEICFDCGFENLSHFNRVFRRLRGMNPRDYRKQH